MGINLGFESLLYNEVSNSPYDTIDRLIEFNRIGSELIDTCYQFDSVLRAYENVCAIQKCIRRYGVTRSLEALYGENFSSAASMEEETAQAKEGLGAKIAAFFKKIWAMVTSFWNFLVNREKWALNKLHQAQFKGPFTVSLYPKGSFEKTVEVSVKTQQDFNTQRTILEDNLSSSKAELGNKKTELANLKNSAANEQTAENLKKCNEAISNIAKRIKTIINSIGDFTNKAAKAKPENAGGAAPAEQQAAPQQAAPEAASEAPAKKGPGRPKKASNYLYGNYSW